MDRDRNAGVTASKMNQLSMTLPSGETISYQVIRRSRRTIGLKVSEAGLIVHAPMRLSLTALAKLVESKSAWIEQKLANRQQHQIPALQWQSGESLLFMGNAVTLVVKTGQLRTTVTLSNGNLEVMVPAQHQQTISETTIIQKKILQWYLQQAKQDFVKRIANGAHQLGVTCPPVKLSNARSRWGSCSSRGEIRLSWRLIQAAPALIDYVVAHELAHLKEMNHSPRFWNIVKSLYPDYKQAESALKAQSTLLHRI